MVIIMGPHVSSAVWVAMTSGAALPESASLTWNGLAWRLPVLVRKKNTLTPHKHLQLAFLPLYIIPLYM